MKKVWKGKLQFIVEYVSAAMYSTVLPHYLWGEILSCSEMDSGSAYM